MHYSDAIKMLGLKEGFTREELDKAHRKLSRLYHPDLNNGDKQKEEKLKQINLAYDVLLKSFTNKHNNSNISQNSSAKYSDSSSFYEDIELKIWKESKRIEILGLINSIKFMSLILPDYLANIVSSWSIDSEEYFKRIKNAKNLFELNRIVDSISEKIKEDKIKFFEEFSIAFCRENYIKYEEIENLLDFNVNLGKLYQTLLELEKKYNVVSLFRKELEEKISDYRLYSCFSVLENKIEGIINKYIYELKKDINIDRKQLIILVLKEIKECLSRFDDLEKCFNIIKAEIVKICSIENETQLLTNSYYIRLVQIRDAYFGVDFDICEREFIKLARELKSLSYQRNGYIINNIINNTEKNIEKNINIKYNLKFKYY